MSGQLMIRVKATEAGPGIRSSRRIALLTCVAMAAGLALVTVLAGIGRGSLDPVTANAAQGFVWAFLTAAFGKAATLAADRIGKSCGKEE